MSHCAPHRSAIVISQKHTPYGWMIFVTKVTKSRRTNSPITTHDDILLGLEDRGRELAGERPQKSASVVNPLVFCCDLVVMNPG